MDIGLSMDECFDSGRRLGKRFSHAWSEEIKVGSAGRGFWINRRKEDSSHTAELIPAFESSKINGLLAELAGSSDAANRVAADVRRRNLLTLDLIRLLTSAATSETDTN